MTELDCHIVEVANGYDHLPIEVTGHAILCVNGCGIYVIGGWNPTHDDNSGSLDTHYVRHIWKYSFWSHRWSQLGNAGNTYPISLASHSAILLNRCKLLIFGGSLSPLGVLGVDNKCTTYNVKLSEWADLACEGSLPPNTVGHWFGVNAVHDVINNCLYVATGLALSTASQRTLMHKLDLTTLKWEKLEPENSQTDPSCRVQGRLILRHNKLYLLGGFGLYGFEGAYSMLTMPTFCLDSKTWTDTHIAPHLTQGCPSDIACFGCCQSNEDTVFVHGGLPKSTEPFNGILWKLDMQTKQWSIFDVPSPLPALWFHQMCFNNDDSCIYIFGGCKTRDYSGARDNCLRRVRVSVPSLSCLCLETMAKASNYQFFGVQCWVDAGIPGDILKRRMEF